jgi:hypothetical protein
MAIEAGVHQLTTLFHQELIKRGIPISYHDYGPGTHTWPYWERDLREVVKPLLHDLTANAPPPATIDFQSDAADYTQWGWHVVLDRPAREFSRIQGASAGGFTLSGSGSATVRTPASYAPGAAGTATLDGDTVHASRRVTADRAGRLTLTVPLGPGNPAQQSTPGATTRVFTTRVRIDAPSRSCASRRSLAVTVRLPRHSRVRVVRATAGGRHVAARRQGSRVVVRLAGLPRGRYRVVVTVRATRRGRTMVRTVRRTARTCVPRRPR